MNKMQSLPLQQLTTQLGRGRAGSKVQSTLIPMPGVCDKPTWGPAGMRRRPSRGRRKVSALPPEAGAGVLGEAVREGAAELHFLP